MKILSGKDTEEGGGEKKEVKRVVESPLAAIYKRSRLGLIEFQITRFPPVFFFPKPSSPRTFARPSPPPTAGATIEPFSFVVFRVFFPGRLSFNLSAPTGEGS